MRILMLLLMLCISLNSYGHSEQRIIALAPHIVENLYAIGAGEHIVATVEHADYPQAAQDIPRIGGYYGIQIEKVLALQPTLVVVWQSGNKAKDIEALKRLGVPLLVSQVEGPLDIAKEIRAIGELTGHAIEAEQVAAQFEQRYQRLKEQYQSASQQRKKVFYQLWPKPMMTVNNNTLIGKAIELCGGDNVFADSRADYPQISVENVLLSAPDVIVMADEKGADNSAINWQQWTTIPAVKHNHINSINADLLHRYSLRLLDGIEQLCTVLNNSEQQAHSRQRDAVH
ncbi:cobalamin-binding protein [Pseudoalteromonas ruthenica]|uniref:Fe/B12 periplasmic-binding domain-containing protein n=1 Tax=Pseudoalteromonas ruthenica TaxID=151081 RepID=A0A0F4PKS5_9GAMM|nr:cobalamin-binding protein [Pseudoalteromonas ruthenica]KJY94836.1 hypothetical protein TW76_17445 [Pseudoalteromonas ruthenica]KJY98304.1 hypothetical protein TW72_11095 [Pseudoalteromonas ruthenica]TMO89429.1 cobalamin-binding protein [Pseudoalteromonas ruthenica]TMO93907.1 cobalamin-binding protein [Pseudoalteromonas ruthenica]TMO98151.1 cobalamin-binding protein [Pseudoalteromonas ruthenica]